MNRLICKECEVVLAEIFLKDTCDISDYSQQTILFNNSIVFSGSADVKKQELELNNYLGLSVVQNLTIKCTACGCKNEFCITNISDNS